MLIDRVLIVEIKASEVLPRTAIRQLNNYLRATELDVGLLLHFGPEPKVYRQTRTKRSGHFRTDNPA
jgi:GxxExxY protein